jgi:hypothetical protein
MKRPTQHQVEQAHRICTLSLGGMSRVQRQRSAARLSNGRKPPSSAGANGKMKVAHNGRKWQIIRPLTSSAQSTTKP